MKIMPRIIQTVSVICKDNKVLLGMKKRGFGEGKWNGFGGKAKNNESVFDAAKRELKEEAGIEVSDLEEMGVINFQFENKPEEILEVHFLKRTEFSGEPVETDEMKPQWFDIKNIPYDLMWPDDKFWLPLFLEGKKFRGRFLFDDYNKIVEHKIEIVKKI